MVVVVGLLGNLAATAFCHKPIGCFDAECVSHFGVQAVVQSTVLAQTPEYEGDTCLRAPATIGVMRRINKIMFHVNTFLFYFKTFF